MNDEIEKILDKLYLDFEKAGLTAPEYSDLRDYITNLQQENEDYKSRVEKAVEYIKAGKTFDNEYTMKVVECLQNNLLNILNGESNEESNQLLDDYKSRVNKAIELLKNTCYSEDDDTFYSDLWKDLPELLRILKGGD